MSDPILDFFPHGADLRDTLANHARLHGESPNAISLAQLAAACLDAETTLSDFKDGSAIGSRLIFAHMAPHGKRNWRVDRMTEVEMTRRPEGWTLLDLRRIPPKPTPTRKLICAAADLLSAAGEPTEGPCADRFLAHLREGAFPIDAPLPGAYASSSHPKPMNALAFCALHGRSEWIRKLIAMGADPNHVGPYGKTALHMCASGAHMHKTTECVRLLLEAGANPRATTASGKTPSQSLRPEDKSTPAGALLVDAARSALESKRIAHVVDKSAAPALSAEASSPHKKQRL